MKFVFLSDSHNQHYKIKVQVGDFLIHSGDISSHGSLREIKNFSRFLSSQAHKHKIVIAGNHDLCFADERRFDAEELIKSAGGIYLKDSGVQIEGLNFWGAPASSPWLPDWAFSGQDIKKHWDLIPENTDVLITHIPPYGILDKTQGNLKGCKYLLKRVKEVKPKIHAFGHIHESYGVLKTKDTVFINASNLNREQEYKNPPISLDK